MPNLPTKSARVDWMRIYQMECDKNAALRARVRELEAAMKRIADFCASRCICRKAGPDCPKGRFSWPPPWASFGPCNEWKEPEEWSV